MASRSPRQPRTASTAQRWARQSQQLQAVMRELYREHTDEERAAADAACRGPLPGLQRELKLKGGE